MNRVSLGAQSFRPELLRALERNHAPEEVARALELVRPRFARWSLDLIFGVPGSTLDDWESDLETALGARARRTSRATASSTRRGPPSGSSGTPGRSAPSTRRPSGRCTPTRSTASAATGLAMYEISNFARPGHESRHNLVYWANDAYFGVGLGAARYVRGVRSVEHAATCPPTSAGRDADLDATGPTETLDPEARARETAVLMLRRTRLGLDRDDFAARTGFDLDALLGAPSRGPPRAGLLEDDGRRVRFTPRGPVPGRHRPLRPALIATAPGRAVPPEGGAPAEPGSTSEASPGSAGASPSRGPRRDGRAGRISRW